MSHSDTKPHAPPSASNRLLTTEQQAERIAAVEHHRLRLAAALLAHPQTREKLAAQEANRAFSVIQKASTTENDRHECVLGSLLMAGEQAQGGDEDLMKQWLDRYRLIPAWIAREGTGHADPHIQTVNVQYRSAINTLITPYMPLVHKTAAQAPDWALDREDRFQQGCLGLIEAAECVQCGRAAFSTHAMPYVHGAIAKAVSAAADHRQTMVYKDDIDMPVPVSSPLEPRDLNQMLDLIPPHSRQLLVQLYGLYRHPDVSARDMAKADGVTFQRIYYLRNKAEARLASSVARTSKIGPDIAIAA